LTIPLRKAATEGGDRANILRRGENVWRIESAGRVAMLVDGAEYFLAAREAMIKAKRSIQIMGWDIHSRTRLVGETGKVNDGFPDELAPFLTALVEANRNLNIYILLWDFAVLYAGEREWLPQWRLDWKTPDRIHFNLDSAVPLGASQHQKVIVVDEAVAFSGGLDLTIRRWDTKDHKLENPHRVDPAGVPYPPFHDIQAVVDGNAAAALADIFCERWELVTGSVCERISSKNDAWPPSVQPLFRNVDVGIARTRPGYNGQKAVTEVQQLFFDSIDAAEKFIYIENQFLTSQPIAERICLALQRRPGLEVVFVAPHKPESWIEKNTMHYGRVQFAKRFEEAGVSGRVRMLCLSVPNGRECVYPMIHSKVMVVDDKFFLIGSANLNNRSMGTDTECDVSIEANSPEVSRQIARARNMLLAEHCKCNVEQFAAVLDREGSLIKAIEHFSESGSCLQELQDDAEDATQLASYLAAIADPERPVTAQALMEFMGLQKQTKEYRRWGLAAGAVLLLAILVWLIAPLGDYVSPEDLKSYAGQIAKSPWAPFVVIGAFILAASIIFPINALIIAVAAAFGPWLGFLYSLLGTMLGSLVTYGLGRLLGKRAAKQLIGARLDHIREKIVRKGIMSVATIRLVPIAPFAVVNFVAGVSQIKLFDYVAGTLLGILPGVAVLSFLGKQAIDVITRPTMENVLLLGLGLAGWIGLIASAQFFVAKLRK
jgi:phospholipase D1/2